MTDTQFYILVSVVGAGLAGVGAAIRFSASRIVMALDANSKAMLENTKSNAILTTKIEGISDFVQKHVTISPPSKRRAQSQPTGVALVRDLEEDDIP